MLAVIVFMAGLGTGVAGTLAIVIAGRPRRPGGGLPPATARQVERARRASRLYVSPSRADFDGEDTRS